MDTRTQGRGRVGTVREGGGRGLSGVQDEETGVRKDPGPLDDGESGPVSSLGPKTSVLLRCRMGRT